MSRIVLKSALLTVGLLIVLGVAVFGIWILGFPASMASVCEKTGNYSFAVTCASLSYRRSGEVSDLARCAEDGIMSGKDGLIVKYGGQLIAHDQFEELCTTKDGQLSEGVYGEYRISYKSYLCGNVAAAQYRAGETAEAIGTASQGGVAAFTKLVIAVIENSDADAAEKIRTALEELPSESGTETYLETLKSSLMNIGE